MAPFPQPRPASDSGVPERLGAFKINGILGKGGMGVVFDAQTEEGQPVALKIIQPVGEPERTETIVRRFLREARILGQLDHPCVVHLVDAGDMDGTLYLAMERIEGVSLLAIRRQGPLTFDPVLQLGRQLADALVHMHGLGVVHRDIKPANILVQPDGRPVITDFGISGMSDATGITRQGDLLGSPGFMSPEVIAGRAPTALSDQYALGRLLFELAALGPSLRLPKNAPIFEILSLAGRIDWERFPEEGQWPQLAAIISRMLSSDPSERFESAVAVRSALDGLGSSVLDTDTLSEHIVQLALPTSTSFQALASDLVAVMDESTVQDDGPIELTFPSKIVEPAVRAALSREQTEATLPPQLGTGDLQPMEASVPSDSVRQDTMPPVLQTLAFDMGTNQGLGASDPSGLDNGAHDEAATRIGPLRTTEYVQNLERQALDNRRRLQALEESLAEAKKPRRPSYWILFYAAMAGLGGLAGTRLLPPMLSPAPQVAVPTVRSRPSVYTYSEDQVPSTQDRQSAQGLLLQAEHQLTARNLDRAEELLGLCVELADLAECHRGLGAILRLTGAPKEARTYIERYLQLSPDAPDAQALRQSLHP